MPDTTKYLPIITATERQAQSLADPGIRRFVPICDTEWEWVCDKHGRWCMACPRDEERA